jgi:ABC-type lipoprotein export system ATPase subunit
MLKLENLNKQFGKAGAVEAVSDMSLDLERGQFLAIVGRSGSGKSTLLSMIGGINKPTSGTILIDSINQWTLNDEKHSDFRNQKIGFVFQFASLLPTLRAIDNVALPALIGGNLSYKEAYARARSLLNHVGLNDRQDSFPSQLSGGEQRRVAIARALINSPSLMLADEPTADLDQETEDEILNLLLEIHRAFNLTVIVVTHSASIAQRADKVIRMNKAKLEETEYREQSTLKKTEYHEQSTHKSAPEADLQEQSRAEKIFNTEDKELTAAEKIRLGDGVERMIGRYVMWLIPILLLVWGVNAGISTYEKNVLDAKENQRIELEDLAMKGLRADIKNVKEDTGKSYTVTLYLNNVTGESKPIYVMTPVVRGFVQVGNNWQEVPMKPVQTQAPKVLKITGDQTYDYTLEPDVTGYAELLPYYMHVRITNDMIVSPNEQPKVDLIERNDSYYVYLKPRGLDDSVIQKKMKFPGKAPVWIPMPPH